MYKDLQASRKEGVLGISSKGVTTYSSGFRRRYKIFTVCSEGQPTTLRACCKVFSLRRHNRRDTKVAIDSKRAVRAFHNVNLIARIFHGLPRGRNFVNVNRIQCDAAKSSVPDGVRPLRLRNTRKPLTLTRGKGLIGAGILEGQLLRDKSAFRAAVSARVVVGLLTRTKATIVRSEVGNIVSRVHNTCTIITYAGRTICKFQSPFNCHPVTLNGARDNCMLYSRAPTLSTVSTRFIHSVLPKRVMEVSSSNIRDAVCKGGTPHLKVYTFRCVCFTHPSSIVGKRSVCRTHLSVNHRL